MGERENLELHLLSQEAGIEEHASLDTKRDILRGLGYKVDSDQEVRDSLKESYDEPYKQVISPTSVIRENRQQGLEIVVPKGQDDKSFQWSLKHEIIDENSEVKSGSIKISETKLLGEREIDGVVYERRGFNMPADVPLGYHDFSVTTPDGKTGTTCLISAPQKCYQPIDIDAGEKTWGVPAQLYALRSENNQGIGDFSDLAQLGDITGRKGAGILGVSPLHAMFPDKPEEASPYAPSSRTFFNHIFLDVTAIPEFKNSKEAKELFASDDYQKKLMQVRNAEDIDYTSVMELKEPILKKCFENFKKNELGVSLEKRSERADKFTLYTSTSSMSDSLDRFATFQALSEHFSKQDPKPNNWHEWPEEYKKPDSPAVKKFATENKEKVDFYKYLQFETDRQIGGVAKSCKNAGMSVGLYTDLAVGVSGISAEAWAEGDSYAKGVTAGAPPDMLSANGQNWLLLPIKPKALKETNFKPFRDMLSNNMKHSGCTRLDHVLQLRRLFLIPEGKTGKEGAFIDYPVDDLMAIVALESHRNKAMTIGEDLGNMAPGFREAAEDHGILSYRVMPFEGGNSPENYPRYATAASSTHDTPSLTDQWKNKHVWLKKSLGFYSGEEQANGEFEGGAGYRETLNNNLKYSGSWEAVGAKPVDNPREDTEFTPDKLEEAVAHFIAKSNSAIALMPMGDILGTELMGNIPGTVQEHTSKSEKADKDLEFGVGDLPYKNWRPKEPFTIEAMEKHPKFKSVAEIFEIRSSTNGRPDVRPFVHPGFDKVKPRKIVLMRGDKRIDADFVIKVHKELETNKRIREMGYAGIAEIFSEPKREAALKRRLEEVERKRKEDSARKAALEKKYKLAAINKNKASAKKHKKAPNLSIAALKGKER